MFKELTRKNKQLPPEQCILLLQEQHRGILSVSTPEGYPYCMPMNHYYDPRENCIYFHCGRAGHRLDALAHSDKVCFCVCEPGHREKGNWFYTVRSVVVFGRMEVLDDPEAVRKIARQLSYKFTQDECYIQQELDRYTDATLLLKLTPEHICGKTVNEC